jgi:hypothetical protein
MEKLFLEWKKSIVIIQVLLCALSLMGGEDAEEYKHKVSIRTRARLGEGGKGGSLTSSAKSLAKPGYPYSERSFSKRMPQATHKEIFKEMYATPPRVEEPSPPQEQPKSQNFIEHMKQAGITYKWLGQIETGEYVLDLTGCQITDISFLKNAPIAVLNLKDTRVTNLVDLAGMKLVYLNIEGTAVSDLSPIKGMPLRDLRIRNSAVTDLTPLEDMPIRYLAFSSKKITRGLDIVRNLKSIQTICDDDGKPLSPSEYWKNFKQ